MIESKIISWLKTEVNKLGKNSILFKAEDSVSSVLLFYLLKKCHFEQINIMVEDKNSNIVKYINKKINKNIQILDLSTSSMNITLNSKLENYAKYIYHVFYISTELNCTFIDKLTKNDYKFIRSYEKINGFDLLPFANLFQSTIDKLFLETHNNFDDELQKIFNSRIKQNEKRKDIDITNEELEWIDNLNNRTVYNGKGIIENEDDPTKYPKWFSFTTRQKEIIAKVHQVEKLTRYKYNPNIPIFYE